MRPYNWYTNLSISISSSIVSANLDCNVIDCDVYALYGLTDNEIKYIKNKVKTTDFK